MALGNQIENHCKDGEANLMPLVNFNNCGAKEDCVAQCPYDVFVMKPIEKEDKAKLNLKGKMKTFFFKRKAYITDHSLCQACGICVQVCPENAIKLTRLIASN